MKIDLKKWQADMLKELFEQVPANPAKALEEQVSVITYGDLSVGMVGTSKGELRFHRRLDIPGCLLKELCMNAGMVLKNGSRKMDTLFMDIILSK